MRQEEKRLNWWNLCSSHCVLDSLSMKNKKTETAATSAFRCECASARNVIRTRRGREGGKKRRNQWHNNTIQISDERESDRTRCYGGDDSKEAMRKIGGRYRSHWQHLTLQFTQRRRIWSVQIECTGGRFRGASSKKRLKWLHECGERKKKRRKQSFIYRDFSCQRGRDERRTRCCIDWNIRITLAHLEQS